MSEIANLDQAHDIIELVASTLFGGEAIRVAHATSDDADTPIWTARVVISGTFDGAVSVTCTRRFAHRAARMMSLAARDEQIHDDDARDALAEVANVIGGNIKALLSDDDEPSRLSMPHLVDGPVGRTHVIWASWTQVGGSPDDQFGVYVEKSGDEVS